MERTVRRRRAWAVIAAGVLAASGLFFGGSSTKADELPPFCGYVRTQVVVTTVVSPVWYCDRIDHPNCDAFPAVGPSNLGVARFFVCSNL